jgi:phosphoribosyl-ATP pyrophosphohydrolase
VAGGIAGTADALAAAKLGVDVQVGMALYTGKLDLAECVAGLVDFDKSPLVPTVVRDEAGQVLMLAFGSPDSLRRALREGKGIYFSRSRNENWEKGLTSGHVQALVSCRMDCDRDALLFTVRQTGPACHAGSYSCFGDREFGLAELFEVLKQRRLELPEGSYSVKLFRDREKLKRKIMEEAFETATAKDRRNAVWEIADLLYHASVLAVAEGIEWEEIEAELGGRHK